jgi:hypothetical protein
MFVQIIQSVIWVQTLAHLRYDSTKTSGKIPDAWPDRRSRRANCATSPALASRSTPEEKHRPQTALFETYYDVKGTPQDEPEHGAARLSRPCSVRRKLGIARLKTNETASAQFSGASRLAKKLRSEHFRVGYSQKKSRPEGRLSWSCSSW